MWTSANQDKTRPGRFVLRLLGVSFIYCFQSASVVYDFLAIWLGNMASAPLCGRRINQSESEKLLSCGKKLHTVRCWQVERSVQWLVMLCNHFIGMLVWFPTAGRLQRFVPSWAYLGSFTTSKYKLHSQFSRSSAMSSSIFSCLSMLASMSPLRNGALYLECGIVC